MKNLVKPIWVQTFIYLLFIMFHTSCEKDEDDNEINNDFQVNIIFSTDSIPEIHESISIDGTCFLKNAYQDDETVYFISIGVYHPDKQINNIWAISVHIPENLYESEGIYELGNYMEGNWVELERYFEEDNKTRVLSLKSYEIENNTSYFILNNETDTTFNINFNNIYLYNSYMKISALASCNIVVRKCGPFWD